MASLSLPRVLQLKKNSLDAEREQFEKFQTLAIQKAINAVETPVKEKHVRSTIIGTFQEQSAITYWMVAFRLPLQDNRIVSWKFCHVTHKLLREGHPACLDDSQRHIGMIENLGKLWVHLREGYGKLVHLYCNLLVCKLKFHARNPRFPGNMLLTADELDAIAENDVNNYFQLCVELFDYMDDILSLQAAVFDSLGNARANSMTASGQCRLAALIPCAQDSSQIYDCNVRLLFRLHAALPADTLHGHRDRFRQQFKKLSSFYKHASSLQYYRNLLTLPVLPANPPNFLQQSDFGTYVTPVVSIPEQPPDEVDSVGALIDTSDTISQPQDAFDTSDTMSEMSQEHLEDRLERPTPSPQPDPIIERDRLIEHLQNELKRMRSELSQLVQERNTMLGSMREHCTRLESQLQTAQSELEEEKHKSEILAVQTPEIKQKLTQTEEKARVQDEKFQKLKGAYTQLREEHISLIRQKAEVDKLSATLRAAAAQHESAKVQLQQQLNDRVKDVELLQQSASSSEEIERYQNQISTLRSELEQSRQKELDLETVKATLEALEIEHKTAKTEQEDKINTISNEFKEAVESLEIIKREKEERETELSRVKSELVGLREKSGDEYKKVVEEKETALKQVVELKEQYQQEKEELTQQMRDSIEKLQAEINELQHNLLDTESNYAMECERINNELIQRQQEFDNIIADKDSEIKEALDKLQVIQIELDTTKLEYGHKLQDLVSQKDHEVNTLKDEMKSILDKNNNEISNLQKILDERSESGELQKSESQELTKKIIELEKLIVLKNKELEDAKLNFDQLSADLEKNKAEHEYAIKENKHQLEIVEIKLQNVTENKDEILNNFKSMVVEKDSQVIALNIEVTKLSEEVSRLNDQLNETEAELEIGKNELMTLKEEHENVINQNDDNLTLKNKELREFHNELKLLKEINAQLQDEKNVILNETAQEKQVLERENLQLLDLQAKLTADLDTLQTEKEALEIKLNDQINNIKAEYDEIVNQNSNEIKILNDQIQNQELMFKQETKAKDEMIRQVEENYENLNNDIAELQRLRAKEKAEMEFIVSEKDSEKQILEARLSHIDMERLNAESELQDLLQHNSVLEADLAAVKKQLEEAHRMISEQSSKLVSCTGEAALEMMNNALASLERSNAQESNKAAAELATKALEDLARHTEIKGNEESIAKSALSVAHNAAQLSAYVTEVSHISTNVELSDKLTSECRSMLTATKQCLETVSRGEVTAAWLDTKGVVRAVARAAAAAADTAAPAARSVDDELADMDHAIEQAANKIEEMLAASRAGDSGVKLEVNEKILDACTTLMGAVKILVQDARKLQNELGDPNTRQKMYRKNPQWSEGLISAAKAVVFAAKLLVSSADEVLSSSGSRVEGVSAAAHEVAGATAQLVAASRARAPPAAPALARLTHASRDVAAAVGALVAAVRLAAARHRDADALDTSALTLTATRRLEMESKVRSLELETELEAERIRLAALRKRHYQLAQAEENGNVTNGK